MGKRKKSYNPFKMWGSYVGAILYSAGYKISNTLFFNTTMIREEIFGGTFIEVNHTFNFFYPVQELILTSCHGGFECMGYGLFTIISLPIVGFLLGWGIHSLFRRISK